MIKETDGDRFEAMRCLNQELTFEAAKKEFALRKVEFGPQQMRTLKLIDQDNLYSNLGLLLSDQCVHTIKVDALQHTGKAPKMVSNRHNTPMIIRFPFEKLAREHKNISLIRLKVSCPESFHLLIR